MERITKSPIVSETMSLAKAADTAYFVALMVKQIYGLENAPKPFCKIGNKSLAEYLKNPKVIQHLRLRVDIVRLWEMVKLGEIEVQCADKTVQFADPLTKYGASAVRLMAVLKSRKL